MQSNQGDRESCEDTSQLFTTDTFSAHCQMHKHTCTLRHFDQPETDWSIKGSKNNKVQGSGYGEHN